MCGIAGAINFEGLDDSVHGKIKSCTDALTHRGPDAEGHWHDGCVSLGHRRLSIIDLSDQSNQPMLDGDGTVSVVFNGEIYNHADIREQIGDSFEFKTDHSDTEVIINAYKKWGIDCLERFVGMFAIALYDISQKKVFLVRDRLGKKPLYWTEVDDTLYFTSEIQSLFEAGILEKTINPESIYHYLTFLTVPAPQSFYQGINKVEAGHYLEISNGELIKKQYWNLSDYLNTEGNLSYDEAVAESKKLLEASMVHRNVADVPISIALSGGLDSSLNLCFTNSFRSDEVSTINISYEETSEFDESQIAEKYTKELGATFLPKKITEKDFINWIEEYLSISKDIPTGDPNTALMYGICKIARQNGFKVLLVGEGGDELGGYPAYEKLVVFDKFTRFIPSVVFFFLSKIPFPSRLGKKIRSILDCPSYARRFLFGFTEKQKKDFWKKEKSYDSYAVIKDYCDEVRNDSKDSFLRKLLNTEYKLRLAELLLPRVDYPSMAASVEARSPFMDHKLIEFTSSIGFELKMRDGPKTILREIAQKLLPGYIMDQPKVGFGMLLNPFLKKTIPIWYEREILEQDSPIKKYVDSDFLHGIHQEHLNGANQGYRLWILFSLNKWLSMQ